jgi:hypothetical protein
MADKDKDKTEAASAGAGRGETPPEFKFDNKMAQEPIVAPDGHEVLSQADIDARDGS